MGGRGREEKEKGVGQEHVGGAGGSLSASYSQEVEISSCRTQSHLSQSSRDHRAILNECFPITLGSTGYCLDRSCPWKTCTGMGLFSLNQKDPPTPTHTGTRRSYSHRPQGTGCLQQWDVLVGQLQPAWVWPPPPGGAGETEGRFLGPGVIPLGTLPDQVTFPPGHLPPL